MIMTSVIQTAQYILSKRSLLTTMGLERLTFFSQCRYCALYASLLYPEKSYKRPTSPVSYELMALHAGKYLASAHAIGTYGGGLKDAEKESCDWVMANFGGGLWRQCREWNLTGHGEEITMEDIKRIAALLLPSTPPAKLKGQLLNGSTLFWGCN